MNLELVDTMYGSFYCFKGNDLITKRLKQLGAYERNDLAMALSFLRQGDTVLDVGYSAKDLEEFLINHGYHLFRNIGAKNSGTDEYTIGHLPNLAQSFLYEENHYNVLAVHPQSDRYPLNYRSKLYTRLFIYFKQVKGFVRSQIK